MKGTDGTVDNRTKELWSSVSGLTMHVTENKMEQSRCKRYCLL